MNVCQYRSLVSKSMKCFTVSRCATVDEFVFENHSPLLRKSLDHLLDGFNTTIITHGERQAGKSLSMFGVPYENTFSHKNDIPKCLVHNFLGELYAHASKCPADEEFIVGVSAWILHGQNIVDLCTPSTNSGGSNSSGGSGSGEGGGGSTRALLDFAVIECPDLRTCLEVLRTARSRAPSGCVANDPDDVHSQDRSRAQTHVNGIPKESQCGHFFFRIILHREFNNGAR